MAFLQGELAAAKRSVVGHVASCSARAELVTWAAGRHRAIAIATNADNVLSNQGRLEKARSVKSWLTDRKPRYR